MKVQVAALANALSFENGQLSLIRCFDQLRFTNLPATANLAVGIILRPTAEEVGMPFDLILKLVYPDGASLEIGRESIVPESTGNGVPAEIPRAIGAQNVTFYTSGDHRIDIYLSDQLIGDIMVDIIKE